MTFNDLLKDSVATFILNPSTTTAAAQYEDHEGPTHARLFHRDQIDLADINEEFETWLETAEDVAEDEDLVLCGYHPIDEELQVERLFYYRTSNGGGGPVYSVDVDGTVVPGSLAEFAPSFDCFTAS